jgi:hypothetical protein
MRFGMGAEAAGVFGLAAAMLADMIRFRLPERFGYVRQTLEQQVDRILTTKANMVNHLRQEGSDLLCALSISFAPLREIRRCPNHFTQRRKESRKAQREVRGL